MNSLLIKKSLNGIKFLVIFLLTVFRIFNARNLGIETTVKIIDIENHHNYNISVVLLDKE